MYLFYTQYVSQKTSTTPTEQCDVNDLFQLETSNTLFKSEMTCVESLTFFFGILFVLTRIALKILEPVY